MKIKSFSSRITKEILRDKINLFFGIGFPVGILLLLTAIQSNVPVEIFEITKLSPGIAVFGLSFISLFCGMIVSKDRSSSFMLRLFTSPMKASDFIIGYTLPIVPMAIVQIILCFIAALILGLKFTFNIFLSIIVLIPAIFLFIGIGLLCGSLFTDKQVGGVCGALLTNVTAFLSGTWFDLDLVGGGFKAVAEALPFAHAVNAGKFALNGDYDKIISEIWWVIGYAVVIFTIAIIIFTKKMKSDNH